MATPNYGYEKRQRELANKKKKEDKLRAKAAPARQDGNAYSNHGDAGAPAESQNPTGS